MMQVFEAQSSKGTLRQEYYSELVITQKTSELDQDVHNEEWYRITHHECSHDEGDFS